MQATTMPPTLGDRLGDVMWERKHTPDDVAALIGADPTDIDRWAGDRLTPGPGEFAALAGYLEVDVDEVKRLVLRSQMRKVQRDIHTRRVATIPPG